jgi:signal transduction histidine kinase
MFDDVLKHRSGRVIALGRALLAALFLFAIWIDPNEPAQNATVTYTLLGLYVAVAIAVVAAIWNDWWLDAKLAAPMHFIDMVAYALLVYATDGYTSPFFLFFVFIVISAAIRWGFRETALTVVAVVLLYLAAGFFVGLSAHFSDQTDFDLQRFIVRSGHLIILSAILIWFGVNQGFSGFGLPSEGLLSDSGLLDSPLESALSAACRITKSDGGLLLWRTPASRHVALVQIRDGRCEFTMLHPKTSNPDLGERSFLFRLAKDRALTRGTHRRAHFFRASEWLDPEIGNRFGFGEGLAIPVRSETGEGQILLGGIDGLCTDHIELADRIASATAAHLERHALLQAVSDSAIARARLALSRDLHDSIVQFLAGATFKVEAATRAAKSGGAVESDLRELKQLLLEEQRELRSAIGALRNNNVALPDLAADLRALCERLARQWNIECKFDADVPDLVAPMRLHLDAHQLVREAVANAVRHAGAPSVLVNLRCEDENLVLEITNPGSIDEQRTSSRSPWSLRERVDEASGSLMLMTHDNRTTVSITLPLKEERPF